MDKGYKETLFLRNGQVSSLHCLREYIKTPGECTSAHYHRYCEILYGIDCDINIWIDDRLETFQTGDICFIYSDQTHFMYSERSDNQYNVIKFSPDILRYDGQMLSEIKQLFSTLYNDKSERHVIPASTLDGTVIHQIFYDIFQEWNSEEPGYEFAIRGQILRLFSLLLRIRQAESTEKMYSSVNDETVTSILATANYILEHYDTVTEREAAAFSHMSYSYFSRMFKKIMGKSFSKFINSIRIDTAKKLLLTDSLSVTEIAEQIGFSSSSHLIASFKQETGLTPHQYRTQFKEIYQTIAE